MGMLNKILLGDCYELMKGIPDGSIDLVLTDPPYNTTACDWDKQPIDLPELWKHLKRVLKPKGAVVMTGSQPFTTDLIMSNRKWFKYCSVWDKRLASGALNAEIMPLKIHEDIIIFCPGKTTYNKQMRQGKARVETASLKPNGDIRQDKSTVLRAYNNPAGLYYPTSILEFSNGDRTREQFHPTQKPTELFSYLSKTYSNPGETILDPFCGSGTTALAAHATGRQFICFEKEPKYFEIANKRLALAQMQGRFEEMVG